MTNEELLSFLKNRPIFNTESQYRYWHRMLKDMNKFSRKAERERCAKVCRSLPVSDDEVAEECAQAIENLKD